MKKTTLILTLLFAATLLAESQKGNTKIKSFSKAKRLLYSKIYDTPELRKTIYCGCSYNKKKKIDFTSYGYKVRKNKKRAKRVEAKHIVPAYSYGQSFKEWREGDPKCVTKKGKKYKGRKCAKKNEEFSYMTSDLYALAPSVGEVNADRSNFGVSMIDGEQREYGKCDVEIAYRKVEPRPEIRGDIARVYMYMDSAIQTDKVPAKTIWSKTIKIYYHM